MSDEGPGTSPFEAHVGLLQSFLAWRDDIVAGIEDLLNAQRRPVAYLQDRPLLARLLEDCFFAPAVVTGGQTRLRGQLLEAHQANGFRPHQIPGLHNDIVDPAEMTMRGFHCWRLTRWPGRTGRLRYANTLFNLYLLRCLELLAMRVADSTSGAGDRLAQVQTLLDRLWKTSPADQPVLLRDARWLIPLAQSPTTLDLGAYLEVAQRVAENLPARASLEIQKAHVRIAGGHLCSQTRHYCIRDDVPIDDHRLLLRSRRSNALDFCILIQGLVPLLDAYERALGDGDAVARHELAGAICQGISADPELFVNRIELLGPYSMIEHVFVEAAEDGQASYTPLGQRHLRLLESYEARIDRTATALLEDCPRLRPVDRRCSPYGVIFGTGTNLIEDMALKTLQLDAETRFSLEDVFVDGDEDGARLAWVEGWRQLPHVGADVRRLYAYPQAFAAEIFDRVERALRARVADESSAPVRIGRLGIVSAKDPLVASLASTASDFPIRYVLSSDRDLVSARRAEACDELALVNDRQEGHFAVSYQSPRGWVAVSKDFLTDVLGAGLDATIAGLPPAAADVLRLQCPGLLATTN